MIARLVEKLQAIPAKSWLIAIVVGYAVLVAWYFVISAAEALKYAITIGGILLATVVREAASKEWKTLRLVAICIPVAAVAAVQANDSYKASLGAQRKQLEDARERARDLEARLREELVLDPKDTIEAIRNADRGFLAKADGLAFRAALKGAQAQKDIARLQELQISYRKAAAEFRKEVKPIYEKMLSLNERSSEGDKEFKARLAAVTERVAESAARYRIAGLYNHAGMLAMACRQNERALSHFYQALAVEREHLPAYESLGYALWIVNLDAYGALNLSSIGLKEHERLRAELDAGMKATTLRADTKNGQDAFVKHLDDMNARLKLQYAYFSALQYQNEEQARAYAGNLYKSNRDDPEYQDTWGYVLMRFAKDRRELEQAIELFRGAIANPGAERITKSLATAHLQQASDLLNRLKGR